MLALLKVHVLHLNQLIFLIGRVRDELTFQLVHPPRCWVLLAFQLHALSLHIKGAIVTGADKFPIPGVVDRAAQMGADGGIDIYVLFIPTNKPYPTDDIIGVKGPGIPTHIANGYLFWCSHFELAQPSHGAKVAFASLFMSRIQDVGHNGGTQDQGEERTETVSHQFEKLTTLGGWLRGMRMAIVGSVTHILHSVGGSIWASGVGVIDRGLNGFQHLAASRLQVGVDHCSGGQAMPSPAELLGNRGDIYPRA